MLVRQTYGIVCNSGQNDPTLHKCQHTEAYRMSGVYHICKKVIWSLLWFQRTLHDNVLWASMGWVQGLRTPTCASCQLDNCFPIEGNAWRALLCCAPCCFFLAIFGHSKKVKILPTFQGVTALVSVVDNMFCIICERGMLDKTDHS